MNKYQVTSVEHAQYIIVEADGFLVKDGILLFFRYEPPKSAGLETVAYTKAMMSWHDVDLIGPADE